MKTNSQAPSGRNKVAPGKPAQAAPPGVQSTQTTTPSPALPGEATEHLGPEALREHDDWISVNIFGQPKSQKRGKNVCFPLYQVIYDGLGGFVELPYYTINQQNSLEVLEKCFARLGGKLIGFTKLGTFYCICVPSPGGDLAVVTRAQTLPLAICLFAKKLFGG